MMTSEFTRTPIDSGAIEAVIAEGDLGRLSSEQRVAYYSRVCDSVGLNPYTRPFEYVRLQGKITLYAKRDATDQLRKLHRVSVSIVSRETIEGVYVVTSKATMADGRTDESIGAVPISGKKGDDLANAFMKAETKAKRRVTLSIVGLGWLDESELESIPDARHVRVDHATGNILEPATKAPQLAAPTNGDALDSLLAAIEAADSEAALQLASDAAKRVWRALPPVAQARVKEAVHAARARFAAPEAEDAERAAIVAEVAQ